MYRDHQHLENSFWWQYCQHFQVLKCWKCTMLSIRPNPTNRSPIRLYINRNKRISGSFLLQWLIAFNSLNLLILFTEILYRPLWITNKKNAAQFKQWMKQRKEKKTKNALMLTIIVMLMLQSHTIHNIICWILFYL